MRARAQHRASGEPAPSGSTGSLPSTLPLPSTPPARAGHAWAHLHRQDTSALLHRRAWSSVLTRVGEQNLAEAAYRFNRGFQLRELLPRFATAMMQCKPCPEPVLRALSDFHNVRVRANQVSLR
ncbi:hypothetical protein XpopCFBP1817_08735 [Xanthomonas populi]|uniref:Uncharacterized protein n=1 Tax=Xanthomonas populi TaxID=53414 RepID=A0A2S7EQL5_9XANT|nr:hypothetical protein XpopCFBP1817_08735 [Xanthomonas populi]